MKDEILFELIGSFTITFFGSFIRINNPDDFVAATLGYFLLYLGVTYCSKNHSASLFNPILSFSLLITGFIDKGKSYYLIGS
jgi:glycerol uptake facilitator-like aquaporin